MKVRTVCPGRVYRPAGKEWTYFIRMNGHSYHSDQYFPTEKAAEQAMRETVRNERKRHGLLP